MQVTVRPYLDTFYRYWYVVLLPVILLPLAGYLAVARGSHSYTVGANVYVDQNTVKQLSYSDTYSTPSANAAQDISQFLTSASFDVRVLNGTPRYRRAGGVKPSQINTIVSDLSKNVVVSFSGPNIVQITYLTSSVAFGTHVLQSMLAEIPTELADLGRAQQRVAAQGARQLVQTDRERFDATSAALGNYLNARHIPQSQLTALTITDPQVAALYQADQSASTNLSAAQQALAVIQSQQAIPARGISVVDPPRRLATTSFLKVLLLDVILPLLVGVLLGGAFVVLRTARDHSIRYADEIPGLLGLPVLTVLPYRRQQALSVSAEARE